MITISNCPVCSKSEYADFISCLDYTVSKESFQLVQCIHCQFVFTNPQPNPEDLGNYYLSSQYISHTGKANTLIDHLYLFFRKRSLRWKQKLLPNQIGKLLDYGCGTGEFLKTCQEAGWTVNGVEPSETAREKARGLTGIEINADLPNEPEQYDTITLWHVLEHVSDLNDTLKKLKNLLNKNGNLIIAVPNHLSYDASYYQEFWAGYDVPRHLWHFSQSTMRAVLKKNGLTIVKTVPMKLDSFYVSMLSEKYRGNLPGIIQWIKASYVGFISNWRARKENEYSSLIYIIQK